MRLRKHPAIGDCQIANATNGKNTTNLRQMAHLGLQIAHMLNDMVADDHIKLLLIEGKVHPMNLAVLVSIMNLPIVMHVYCCDVALQSWMGSKVVGNPSSATANLQQANGVRDVRKSQQALYLQRLMAA